MSDTPQLIAPPAPKACDAPKLTSELVALALAGVRGYTLVGPAGLCAGVYAWDASAPEGTFEHLTLDETATEQVLACIAAHDPTPPPSWDALVALRDRRLAATDCTQLADFPMPAGTTASDWAAYRQQLRDAANTAAGDASAWAWPEPPGEVTSIAGVQLV